MTRLAAAFGVFLISFSAIFVRFAGVEPITAAFFRCFYALPFLFLICRARRPDGRSGRQRRLAQLAGAMLGADLIVWHHSIEYIGTGLGTVLGNTQVVFVGLAAWWLHGERPTKQALGVVPVVFLGVVLISGLGRSDAYGTDPIRGVIFGLLTGLSYSAFILLLRAASREKTSPVGPLLDATLGATASSLGLGLVLNGLDFAPHWPAHGWLLALALVSQVFGWLLITEALPRLPALETSVLLLLQPMLTVLWGRLLFSELLSEMQWSGVGLILLGIGTLSLAGGMTERPARHPAAGEAPSAHPETS
ncbi:MAG: DMT family transporter [Thermoanaerobaculia bacterium]|nr:DMT family transporter [Thermoanaerobaculia bacterium]